MPTPDTNGLPPFADFEAMKVKINEMVAKYNNLLVNLDSLNVVSLTADHIDAGTIDANVVTIRSDLTAGAYVQIDGNGMVINNGTFNTFTADINGQVTMTRALIQSSPSAYPRVIMDPVSDLFGAYTSPTNFINIRASDDGDPLLYFDNGANLTRIAQLGDTFRIGTFGKGAFSSSNDMKIESTGGDVYLASSGEVILESWSKLYVNTPGQTLQTALNNRATAGASTGSGGGAALNGGIPIGTQLLKAGGGSETWTGINVPSHSHSQT